MRRLLVSIVLALAFHGLIFGIGGKWLKKRPYTEPKVQSVTISLDYQQLKDASGDQGSSQAHEKKAAGRIDRPVSVLEPSGDPLHKEVLAASDVTAAVVPDHAAQLSNEGYLQKYPKNVPDDHEQAYESSFKEMTSLPVSRIVKEAVPLYKENPAPGYPLLAKKRGYQGTVILEVLVTKEGRAGKVSVFQSSRYSILDEVAVSSVKKWRFEPGKLGDKKVDMPVKIPIRFQLEPEED